MVADFVWRYAHLDLSQRGHDTAVSPASPADFQQIQHVEKSLRDKNPAHREFRVIMILNRDNPEVETPFIISFPPKYTARSPFGRGTRPMLAFNMEMRMMVFLKDYWRADVDGMEKANFMHSCNPSECQISHLLEGERRPRSHDPYAYTAKREVGLLVERHGAPEAIQNVPECRRSAFDFVQLLTVSYCEIVSQ
jgi:hypothetical protein